MTNPIISALTDVFEAIPNIKKNSKGKFSLNSITDLIIVINSVGLLVASYESFLDEYSSDEMTYEEKAKLYKQFKEQFDIENDKLEKLFEGLLAGILEILFTLYSFLNANKAN